MLEAEASRVRFPFTAIRFLGDAGFSCVSLHQKRGARKFKQADGGLRHAPPLSHPRKDFSCCPPSLPAPDLLPVRIGPHHHLRRYVPPPVEFFRGKRCILINLPPGKPL